MPAAFTLFTSSTTPPSPMKPSVLPTVWPYSRSDLRSNAARAAVSSALHAWCEFHEQVRRLPADEREVIDLLFYQELTQAEAANLLHVTVRTVQRRWQSALLELHRVLKHHWPGV